ncbi:hypothetical protein [Staphylococcus phage vB_StaM_SA1]|nr:hypothetical protein [Staphylococcus phage vB_StaM_SA1]
MSKEIFNLETIFKDLTDFQTESSLDSFSHKSILTALLDSSSSRKDLDKVLTMLSINVNVSLNKLNSTEDKMIDIFTGSDISKDKDSITLLLKYIKDIKENSRLETVTESLPLEITLDQIIDHINTNEFHNEEVKNLFVEVYTNLSILIISFKLIKIYDGFNKLI